MIQLFERKSDCYGCGACRTACPHAAITMQADDEGFAYPVIDPALCVDCGLCKQACPIGKNEGIRPDFGMAFLAGDVGESSSGGAFPSLVRAFWEKYPGEPVWGACLDENMTLIHRCITSPEELPALQGSKYVQSDLGDAFAQILAQLRQGQHVLFSGTPCQCAGLARLAAEHRQQLLLVDLVCNGVGSPLAWKRYLAMEQEQKGAAVTAYSFRNRRYYMARGISCSFSDGSRVERALTQDLFSVCYQRNLISRASCYACPYTRPERVSDLTLADFHGLEEHSPDFSNCGASLVLPHTESGIYWCGHLDHLGKSERFPLEKCMQPRLEVPPRLTPLRRLVLRDLLSQPAKIFLLKYQKLLFGESK